MGKNTILIVDDAPDGVGILTAYLKREGFDVTHAVSGELALEQVRSVLPDIILLDIRMPGIDGFETCRQLKADSNTCEIPVLFMTVLSHTENVLKGFEIGAVDYITKPFRHEEVMARIKTHLTIRELQDELREQNRCLQHEIEMRELTESAIKVNERNLPTIMDNSPQIFSIKNNSGKYVFVNRRFEQAFTMNRGDILGKSDLDIFSEDTAQQLQQNDSKVFQRCQPMIFEENLPLKGEEQIYAAVKFPLDGFGRTHNRIGALMKEMSGWSDEDSELEISIREFLLFMGHELSNEMTVISAFSDMLLLHYAEGLDANQKGAISSISASIGRMKKLMESYRDVHQLEKGTVELIKAECNLDLMLKKVIQGLSFSFGERVEINFQCDAPDSIIHADINLLPGMFHNLIKNAAEHVEKLPDEAERTVFVHLDQEKTVRIQNGGELIPPDQLEAFFEKFNTDRRKKKRGSGLGTTHAYLVTKAHQGEIRVESKPEKGTIVTVCFNKS